MNAELDLDYKDPISKTFGSYPNDLFVIVLKPYEADVGDYTGDGFYQNIKLPYQETKKVPFSYINHSPDSAVYNDRIFILENNVYTAFPMRYKNSGNDRIFILENNVYTAFPMRYKNSGTFDRLLLKVPEDKLYVMGDNTYDEREHPLQYMWYKDMKILTPDPATST